MSGRVPNPGLRPFRPMTPKLSTKVSAPKAGPLNRLFGTPPKVNYKKDALREDPSEFTNAGFGDTGMGQTPMLGGARRR